MCGKSRNFDLLRCRSFKTMNCKLCHIDLIHLTKIDYLRKKQLTTTKIPASSRKRGILISSIRISQLMIGGILGLEFRQP